MNIFIKKLIDNNAIANPLNTRPSDINQCLKDWNRGRYDIYIDGVLLEQIYRDEGYTNLENDNKIIARDVTIAELESIWKKYLLKGLYSDDTQMKMIEHMSQYMHQGGYLNMLQASINEIGMEQILTVAKQPKDEGPKHPVTGFLIKDSNSERRIDFTVQGDTILMKDELRVKALTAMQFDEDVGVIPNEDERSKMVVTGKYSLSLDQQNGVPKCSVINVNIEYKNDAMRSLLDPRVLFEKIKEFLEEVYNDVKKALFEKNNAESFGPRNQGP